VLEGDRFTKTFKGVLETQGFRYLLGGSMPTDTVIVDVRSSAIGRTASAKDVARTERTFEITGDTLRYTVRMAAVGLPLQHHLSATLHRS